MRKDNDQNNTSNLLKIDPSLKLIPESNEKNQLRKKKSLGGVHRKYKNKSTAMLQVSVDFVETI